MIKAYRFRLYPTLSQIPLLASSFGTVRYVYNTALSYRSKAYKRRKESINYYDSVKLLNILKKAKPWLKDAYSQSLQMALRNLDTAFINFFRDPANVGYPKFKKKTSAQSLQYPQKVKVNFQTAMVYFPKLGWVPCVFHRRFEGKIKTVTLTKETDGSYYVSILVENEDKAPAVIQQTVNDEGDVLGIDMGVKELCTCSDGTVFENNRYLPKSEKKLKREQKRLSRKKKGSANRNKQRIKVAKVHKKIADQRKDTIEKVTAEIAGKNHAAVAVETLSVKGMVRNHHLAKSVSDASMSAFLTRLETKCRNNGKVFVKVDRWFASSQTCSVCGYVNKEIKDLKIREWECPRCHTMHMRDANASLNIAREGYRLIARLPMDGGEVTPVEKTALQQNNQASAVTDFAESGRVLKREAHCL